MCIRDRRQAFIANHALTPREVDVLITVTQDERPLKQIAEELGISDGDTVEVSNEQHTGKVQVKVTQRINPDALFVPSHYGCSSKEEKTAYGVGLRQMDYVPFRIEPGYGGICSQEAVVTVKKVGA